jgi:hypothetical protein
MVNWDYLFDGSHPDVSLGTNNNKRGFCQTQPVYYD